ncbi:hypothetical protein JFK97_20805 [Chromobacterium phragmitis]|uniref:hypothetical protein n=1 Tax=Chromobacterium amazonense TaxID=1382803 RepID=UPI0021B74D76|nr:hypothetical protein [Chromobacterium amazonense]MBM2886826.1 hypothetical protein [Chromobacterium amazonense]MDE1712022.1 hypothetical protein [Chromobacterium amazonense]
MINVLGIKTVTRSGSFVSKYIPSFYVVVEDELAKSVIDCLYEGSDSLARKYIFSGVWGNQASCLYGFFTYGLALTDIQMPSFGIVAIVDGDVEEKSIRKRINDIIKGNHKNDDQQKIVEMISNSATSFHLDFQQKDINGLPEYNQKKWFEEITEERISKTHKEGGRKFLGNTREISSMLELVEFSKSISEDHSLIKKKNGRPDYHSYYEIIKNDFRPSNTDHKMNNITWYILSCIKYYTSEKWKDYTRAVDSKIRSLYESHKARFMESDFDFRS